jgi:hypothetical protein
MPRIFATWFVMLLVSVANGAVRDFTYGRQLGELAAHQVSTASGALLLGIVMWVYVRSNPPSDARHALAIGLFWMALTLAFEFLFFHYVGGHSWSALLANYDVTSGRVWVVVVAWVALGPYVLFRVRRAVGTRG